MQHLNVHRIVLFEAKGRCSSCHVKFVKFDRYPSLCSVLSFCTCVHERLSACGRQLCVVHGRHHPYLIKAEHGAGNWRTLTSGLIN